jgi:adhesin transport system outer membrane protein
MIGLSLSFSAIFCTYKCVVYSRLVSMIYILKFCRINYFNLASQGCRTLDISKLFKLKSICLFSYFSVYSVQAITVEEGIKQVLATHPIVQERLKNYRATVQDSKIANSAYLPTLDLVSSVGRARTKSRITAFNTEDYNFYENSLILTQNIFAGFSTEHQVDFQQQRILAAANNYIEKSNDVALNLVNVYIQVLLNRELLVTAEENIVNNQQIFTKVQALYDNGQTTLSEVEKIQSSLALAQSNFVVQENNLMDARFNLQRVLGYLPLVESLIKPSFDTELPKTLKQAANIAILHNPSILTSNYNVNAAHILHKERKHSNYPQVDFQLSHNFSDNNNTYGDLYAGKVNETRAGLVLTWNLFSGGADQARVQQQVSAINQEYQIRNDLRRQVVEGLELSWSAYTMVGKQLSLLTKYRDFSRSTLEHYEEEYDFGRRTLLDLLAAQNDFITAKNQIIMARYNRLLAKYRIHDAMGTMVAAVLGDDGTYLKKVGLDNDKTNAEDILDLLPEEVNNSAIDYPTQWIRTKE